jgi:hypothetical protein
MATTLCATRGERAFSQVVIDYHSFPDRLPFRPLYVRVRSSPTPAKHVPRHTISGSTWSADLLATESLDIHDM